MNVKGDIPYWDEGQRGQLYPWYKKGFWKRYLRKRFYKRMSKSDEKENP